MLKEPTSFDERRRIKRRKARLRVLFQRSGWAHYVEAETDNISLGGVYVWTRRRPLDVGTNVSLLLNLSDSEKEVMLKGVVTWVHKKRPIGMGIRFTNLDSSSRELLSDVLQS
jgi:uncharacterized protein (TIGR02266 family)